MKPTSIPISASAKRHENGGRRFHNQSRWRLRRRWTLLGILIALVLIWFFGSLAMAPIVRNRLEAMVTSHLNARLEMGHVTYHFPYGVSIDNASLVSTDDRGQPVELCKASRIDLALAELPVGKGPLVIARLVFTNPVLHLVRTKDGLVGEYTLLKDDAGQPAKLSDIFRLRRFKIDGGQVVYEDRTAPAQIPMVWKNLHIDLNTSPTHGEHYAYNLVAQDLPLVEAVASGTMDIDQLLLDVKNFGIKLQVSPDARQSQLPGELQELLRQHQIDGQLTLNGSAFVPLKRPSQTHYDAVIDLSKASAWVPQWDAALDHMVLKVRCTSETPVEMTAATASARPATSVVQAASTNPSTQPATQPIAPPLYVHIELLEAGSGDTLLRIEKGAALLDPVEGKWRVRQLSGMLQIGANRAALPTQLEEVLQRLNVQGKLEFTARASGPIKPTPGRRAVDDIDYELLTYGRDLTVQPPTFPEPLRHVSGAAHLRNKLIVLTNVEASYGHDKLYLATCRLPLDNVPDELWIRDVSGSINFAPPELPLNRALDSAFNTALMPALNSTRVTAAAHASATSQAADLRYPPILDDICRNVHPSGAFYLTGNCVVRRNGATTAGSPPSTRAGTASGGNIAPAASSTAGSASDEISIDDYSIGYQFDLRSDSAALAVGPHCLPLSNVKLDVTLHTGVADIQNIQASLCGGSVGLTGQFRFGKVVAYHGRLQADQIDLRELANDWTSFVGDKPLDLAGNGFATLLFSGVGPRDDRTLFDNFRAKGDFEIHEGDLWQVPVIKDIVGGIKIARDALTVGEAAGSFEIYDQKIVFDRAAISAPVLGLQGAGEVRFDGQLDARVVAAPLGDWRDKLRQTNVPLISNAASAIAGGVQKMLNAASGKLLYEFRVTGVVAHPSISTIPAPILTDSAARLFGAMLSEGDHDHLIDVVRQDKPPPATQSTIAP